jgi:branched-chain amino acid transport system substrate-binding protein
VVALGCGEPDEDTTSGSLVLTVYAAGPLQGQDARETQDGQDAAKLALEQADGMSGPFTVNVVSLDDADPDTGRWGAEQAVANARRAIADRNIIAYIGMSDSGATALTLPLLNEAGVLQIGPTTGYVGLTRPAGRGEPERFYPSGMRTFGRIAPADDIEVRALLGAMGEEGVRRLAIVHDGELDALGITSLLTREAAGAGIEVVAERAVDDDEDDGADVARDVVEARPDAAIYTGGSSRAAAAVLDALHAADAGLALFATDGVADASFAGAVAPESARRLLVTSPAVPLADLPPPAARFADAFRRTYGRRPVPQAVFTYEAMRALLQAVEDAGAKGNDRTAVIRAWFMLRERATALGTWSVQRTGDTTLRRFGIWRVRDGRLALAREAPDAG